MSFGMAERHQQNLHDSKLGSTNDKSKDKNSNSSSKNEPTVSVDDGDDYADLELDRKELLIVKDGTVRVAESLDREQQQLDANGDVVKASGTWTKAEHERFLKAMESYPKGPWKAIAEMVATRTVRQTQTHAQKYREKLARRMRGLRNRNGTLQTPPLSMPMNMPAIMGYPRGAAVPHYANAHEHVYHHTPHPGALGYTSMASSAVHVTAPLTTMCPTTTELSTLASAAHSVLQQPQFVSAAMSSPTVVSSPEFNQLTTTSISNAFIGNSTYPTSWEAGGKEAVPNFDESMDFLMSMYSSNPNQISSSAAPSRLVTPTACIPRTPRTPALSVVRKRHSELELELDQQPYKKYPKHHFSVRGEQEATDA